MPLLQPFIEPLRNSGSIATSASLAFELVYVIA